MYNGLNKPLYDAEATTLFPNEVALLFQRPSPHGTTLTDLTAESGSSAAPTPLYKFGIDLPSDPKEDEIFKDMIKNWLVSSSDELDSASSTSPAEESQKTSSQAPTNTQVSILGLEPGPTPPFLPLDAIPPFDLSSLDYSTLMLPFDPITSLGLVGMETTVGITPSSTILPPSHIPQSGLPQVPMNPPAHEAQVDVASQGSNVVSSTTQPPAHIPQSGLPQVPMNPPAHGAQVDVTSQGSNMFRSTTQPPPHIPQSGLPEAPINPPVHEAQEDVVSQRSNVLSSTALPETTVGITPSSTTLPPSHIPQGGLPQAPMNPPAPKAQDDVASQRSNSNVLSSILIGSGVPSKCDPVRSVYMNIPRSTLNKRSEREKYQGSKPPLPLSGSGGSSAIKGHKLPSSYPFLPNSSETSTNEHSPFSLDSFLTAAFPLPSSDISLGNFLMISPPSDSPLSLPPYLPNESFYKPKPAKFLATGGLKNPPGSLDLRMSANQMSNPSTLSNPPAVSTTTSGLPPSKTPSDVPLVNIENRSILKRTSSLVSTSTYDTKHLFVYERRANPIRSHKDAMMIMFGTHPLTHGERDIIERISGEQRNLIIERKVDNDAAGGTRRRR